VTVTHISEHNEVDFSLLLRREFPTRFFAKCDTIFREGERGDETFVVVRGQVEIRSCNRCFETLGWGGIFGEMALIDDSPRSATVVALTGVTVAPIKERRSSSWSSTHHSSR
jgi:CRP/FNR family transcriptional regulator, cyclic AMP receptor protein